MASFAPAIEFVLHHEDPSRSGKVTVDSGGRTRFGIAQKFHPSLSEQFFSGPADEALEQAEKFLHDEYWKPMRLDQIKNQNVANKLLDMAVNMGVHQAAVYAQRAVNGLLQSGGRPSSAAIARLNEDGVIGDQSLAAINALNPIAYHQLLCDFSTQHYVHVASVNPTQAMYLQGWLKRASA